MSKKLSQIYKKVSTDLGIDESEIKKAYELYWGFIKHTIKSQDFRQFYTEDEFNKLDKDLTLIRLGRVASRYSRYLRVKNSEKRIRHENKKCEADVQYSNNDCEQV